MNPETLRCSVCSKEVRIVRLNKTTLAFGHTTNPGPASHRVQLARSTADRATSAMGSGVARVGDRQPSSEGLAGVAGSSSHDPAVVPGRPSRARVSMPGHSRPSTARRRVAAGSPPGSGSASPRSAGAL